MFGINMQWYEDPKCLLSENIHPEFMDWLMLKSSTTTRIRQKYNLNLDVDLLSQGDVASWHPDKDNIAKNSWSRNTLLSVQGIPWMLASVVIPRSFHHKKSMQKIFQLGESPIGNLLYEKSNNERFDLRFGSISTPDLQHIIGHTYCSNNILLVKSSLIKFDGADISIMEIFLPHPILHNI